MTTTLTRAGRQTLSEMSLRERRQAAMERMYGEPSRPKRRKVVAATSANKDTKRTSAASVAVDALGQAPGVYYIIMATVAVFVMLGLVMVLSATSVLQVAEGNSPYAIFSRQAMWAGLGLVGMIIVLRWSYQRWQMFAIPAFLVSLALMLLPFAPGIGAEVNDARSWVHLGGFSFQPSEFLKLASLAFLADYFSRNEHRVHLPRFGVIPLALTTGACAGISFAQGDLGSAIVLASIALTVGFIAGVPVPHLFALSGSGVFLAVLAIMTDERRLNRITAFMNIEENKEHLAWQTHQSLLSIANGGLGGSGIGGSKSKLGYLPLAHSDFIFAVIADELGFIGALAVIGGFILLLVYGMQTALAAPDRFGMLMAGGIASWFGVQAIVHMGGVVGVMPVTGLTLPFFSHGGSSLLISMVAAAFMLNIARRAVTDDRTPTKASRKPLRWWKS